MRGSREGEVGREGMKDRGREDVIEGGRMGAREKKNRYAILEWPLR